MNIIKLDATDSTNQFLKTLSKETDLENFTVVYANSQTKGKGQMGATWVSEPGKNLTMSILIKNLLTENNQIFDLNVVVACSIFEVLQSLKIPNISIKWPNDMMADNKKIGGILIENIIKTEQIISIVGIGINVNQTNFLDLPAASSLKCVTNITFEINEIMLLISTKIEQNCKKFLSDSSLHFWNFYHDHLFKKNVPMAFENQDGQKFMGIINKVEKNGKIKIQLEDDGFSSFGVKEVKMLY